MSTKQKISYNLSQLYAGMDSLGFSDIYVTTEIILKSKFRVQQGCFLKST
jgi:hypothetical protein